MEAKTEKPKKKRGCLISVLIFLGFIFIATLTAMSNIPDSDKAPKNLSMIMKSTGINKEDATKVDGILNDCGIQAKEISHDEGLDNSTGSNEKGYRISTQDLNNIILYLREDNSIYSLRYADNFLYDDNAVISKISDYYLSSQEKNNLIVETEKMIKSALKSPSTAKFPNISEWKFYKDKEKIIAQSYVDSQNSFGAMLRSNFQITLNPDGITIKSLIIDGQEYIK